MKNPWKDLPERKPFVLRDDLPMIESWRNDRKRDDAAKLHLELLPEPFLGDPKSPVVLLNLNPGFSDTDTFWHSRPDFSTCSRDNLLHRPAEYPFYLLNRRFANGPEEKERWWDRKLRPLIAEVSKLREEPEDKARKLVARRLFCVEYFAYHSKKFTYRRRGLLRSQEYGCFLVRKALDRRAIVVILRARSRWFRAVPELREYERCFELLSPQNVVISKGNCPDGFDMICDAIAQPKASS